MSTMWNPRTEDDYDHLRGFDVYSSDDEKIGTIKEVLHPRGEAPDQLGDHYFRVEPDLVKELFGGAEEIYVPERAISIVDPGRDRVVLEMPKGSLKQQGWDRRPG